MKLKMRTLRTSLMLMVVSVFLVGCFNVQTHVAFSGQDQWDGVQAIQLSSEFLETGDTGEAAPLDINAWSDNSEVVSNNPNANVSVEQQSNDDGTETYVMRGSGQGLDLANELFFEGEAELISSMVDGQTQISLSYEFSTNDADASAEELSPAEQAMMEQMLASMGIMNLLTIATGEIIESNADRIENDTIAVWENPSLVEITFVPQTTFDPSTIALRDLPAPTFSMEDLEGLDDSAGTASGDEPDDEFAIAPPSSDSDTELVLEDTTGDSATTEETTAEDSSADTADDVTAEDTASDAPATEIVEEAPPTDEEIAMNIIPDPSAEESLAGALPDSGGVIAVPVSLATLIFAGIVLVVLSLGAVRGIKA